MIIPKYWAEARLQHGERKRQVTLRRFGWSDIGEAEAQAHADARAREALQRVLAGEALPRRERRVAYNGAEGMPIREEIVDRAGDTIITRNGYGALCLNTPNVLFADIDHAVHVVRSQLPLWRTLAGLIIATMILLVADSSPAKFMVAALAGIAGGFLFGGALAGLAQWLHIQLTGGFERSARRRIAAFVARHPDWRVRIYRTPAGMRLLALHRLFDPRESEVKACFDALGVDPMYARMCFNQNCFRARISPKPWRMGLPRLHPPYSAVWRPEHADLPARRQWIEAYEREARAYASCRHVETLGSGALDPSAEVVQQLHDTFCSAEQDLKLA